jgi:hypothetical protein
MLEDLENVSRRQKMTAPNEQIAAGDPNYHAPSASAPAEHAPAASHFTDAEWSRLQADDLSAGRAVVLLMLGIFSLGVFLYAAVAFTVWRHIGFLS